MPFHTMRPAFAASLILLAAPVGALAQADSSSWGAFPSAQPTPPPPPPSEPPVQAAPPGTPAPPAPAPGAVPSPEDEGFVPLTPLVDSASKPKPAPGDDATVVSTEERLLPGTEAHSPSTWGNGAQDPTNHRLTSTVTGSSGLLHTSSADLRTAGLLRVSVAGEYLNLTDFPTLTVSDTRTAATFSLSFSPVRLLELYVSYGAASNTNSSSSPRLLQTLGDVGFGGKVGGRLARGFWAGIDLRLQAFAGVGNQDLSKVAMGVTPKVVTTVDIRDFAARVPLLFHANVGASFDGTGNLVGSRILTSAEEFALALNRYNRFTFGLGVEAPLPVVTPFLEYGLAYPLGVPNGMLMGPDGQDVAVAQALPMVLSPGLKVTAIRDLTIFLAADVGLTRQVAQGIPATPPVNFFAGLTFAADPFQRGPTKIVETVKERKGPAAVAAAAPSTGKVTGVVLDARSRTPVPGAIVAMIGANLPPVASDVESGKFLTHELSAGAVRIQASKEGYKEAFQDLLIAVGQTQTVELLLETAVKKAVVQLTVASRKKPVAGQVTFKGAETKNVTTTEAPEPLMVDLAAGRYMVEISAMGFASQSRELELKEGMQALVFDLQPDNRKKLVVVKNDRIEILQQVHFASGKATILQDSFGLLNQVVEAIKAAGIKRLRVEGHTDNKGSRIANLRLSQDRAQAVADFLVKAGIAQAQLDVQGFGDARPVAPNLTTRGRELNRRVEFIILER